MSVCYEYRLEVLATSSKELSDIANRLEQPSTTLVAWAAAKMGMTPCDCADRVAEFVSFYPTSEVANSKHGGFRNSFRNWVGLVRSHIYEVSREFPSAAFLLNSHADSFFANIVVIGGKIIAQSFDSNDHSQAIEWALLDIFPPFRAEHQSGLPFGTLWDEWLADVVEAAHQLRMPAAYATEPPEILDLTFTDELPGVIKVRKPGEPTDLVQKQMSHGVWLTLCNVCHQPIRASVEDFPEDGDEDFSLDADRTVCFEVTPCNVTIEPCMFWCGLGAEECWRKKKPTTFVICADCFAKLGVVPTQVPLSPMREDGSVRNGDIVPSAVVEPQTDETALVEADRLGDLADLGDLE